MNKDPDVKEPIPISQIGNRYLLFDINSVFYLRRLHHICGTPIGTLPQIPQQNLFLGLPMELMREEVKLLTDRNIAYVFNDSIFHEKRFGIPEDEDRVRYLESLKIQGLRISQFMQAAQRSRKEKALAKIANNRAKTDTATVENSCNDMNVIITNSNQNFSSPLDSKGDMLDGKSFNPVSAVVPVEHHALTPTTSYIASSIQNSTRVTALPTPLSYALYQHLHDLGYFILPGLRFGCDYNVYPGDPLRFHSHFIAVGYEWGQNIPTFDIIGGGRLGTAVKKGFLIGGCDTKTNQVRTFTIEWGGM